MPLKKVFFTFNHIYVFYQTRDMYFDRSCEIGSTHCAKIDCHEHINLLFVFLCNANSLLMIPYLFF